MNSELIKMYQSLHLDEKVLQYCMGVEDSLKERFEAIDRTAEYNQLKD